MTLEAGFAFVDEVVPGVRWDAKYATWDNFTGKPVDGYLVNRIVGTLEFCAALTVARNEAASRGFGLLLWDGYRPQRAVDAFLAWSQQPDDGSTKARFYPRIERAQMIEFGYVATPSGHSRGSTVDLTLFHLDSDALVDMDGDHDIMDESSHHGADGVAPDAAANRESLRLIMDAAGFNPFQSEWWHYSLRDEPYPETFFDFPIA